MLKIHPYILYCTPKDGFKHPIFIKVEPINTLFFLAFVFKLLLIN